MVVRGVICGRCKDLLLSAVRSIQDCHAPSSNTEGHLRTATAKFVDEKKLGFVGICRNMGLTLIEKQLLVLICPSITGQQCRSRH